MREELEVYVRGKILTNWTSAAIHRSIDQAAGSFRVRSPGRSPFPIAPGDRVEISAGGDLLLVGHADRIQRSTGPDAREVVIEGRDRTADLVDCSPADDPSEWVNIDLPSLVAAIAGQFGIQVDYRAGPKPNLERVRPRPGDTAWAIIERACRLRGVLVYGDGTGRLVVREGGRDVSDVELVEGENLRSATFTADDSMRFRTYTVRGQRPGTDQAWGDLVTRVEGSATDLGARGGRRLVLIAEGLVTNQTSTERAQWEATVRAAAAGRVDALLGDWRRDPDRGDLRLWALNEQVPLRAPGIDVDGYMLVRDIGLEQTADSQGCFLGLVRPDAYKPAPVLETDDDALSQWLRRTADLEAAPDDAGLDDMLEPR